MIRLAKAIAANAEFGARINEILIDIKTPYRKQSREATKGGKALRVRSPVVRFAAAIRLPTASHSAAFLIQEGQIVTAARLPPVRVEKVDVGTCGDG
ncbi:hypothetical protein ACFSUD_08490 [Sulfitobacter aestuarii]|uniref:Uncharacterized protein n=1 Tax=Sulfitobacter aestuarii TaxID=2161676 RepID=A0ABW5U141_9RHOB